ncbi:aryl-sulfate sulfotransferase [Halobacillus campisalis]|uniref:Aryl-sulfate sulfotransferase n=1 Tax=Halobacillus campisalis TaxID=435909 RepID=A0ABW2K239_9BACI|nr:aryl-sulfate sulfotransferase [Halobacillus campisalis]
MNDQDLGFSKVSSSIPLENRYILSILFDALVEEVWSYGEERGKDFFSNIVGDADYLQKTGNRLITSGHAFEDGNELHSRILETTDNQEAEVVYELKVTGFKEGESRQVYRSERMPLYPENWEIEWSE